MKLRPIGQDDRLSIIDHLDELRSRVIICAAALLVAFAVCFWQNNGLLSVLNRALPNAATSGLGNQQRQDAGVHDAFARIEKGATHLAAIDSRSNPAAARWDQIIAQGAREGMKATPRNASEKAKPIAIGIGEGFTITVAVCAYFALLVTLPLILYEAYAFVIPALSREERNVATPTMLAAPLLFVAGAAFTYFAVLPPAVHFLQGYNSNEFQVLPQAKSYYKFEIMLMMGIGLAFEVPLFALGLQRVGAINASTLTLNWRYALVVIAVIVAALPGVDPVTMTMETLPLIVLYVLSIVLLKWVEHRNHRRSLAEAATAVSSVGEADD